MKYFNVLVSVDNKIADQELVDSIFNTPSDTSFDIESNDNIEEVKNYIREGIEDVDLGISVLAIEETSVDNIGEILDSMSEVKETNNE